MQAGGVPLLLPYEFDAWDVLDGALICGGHDLMPSLGGYEAEPGALAEFRAARDTAAVSYIHLNGALTVWSSPIAAETLLKRAAGRVCALNE